MSIQKNIIGLSMLALACNPTLGKLQGRRIAVIVDQLENSVCLRPFWAPEKDPVSADQKGKAYIIVNKH